MNYRKLLEVICKLLQQFKSLPCLQRALDRLRNTASGEDLRLVSDLLDYMDAAELLARRPVRRSRELRVRRRHA
jgi:hypothetical protein